ncbi:MAG: RNA polymerase factor sigma-32 [Deltaproteobacteria bacterium]|nr:RNA polymerase factor sigma-32 [Deltaproteobacteria bacterium]
MSKRSPKREPDAGATRPKGPTKRHAAPSGADGAEDSGADGAEDSGADGAEDSGADGAEDELDAEHETTLAEGEEPEGDGEPGPESVQFEGELVSEEEVEVAEDDLGVASVEIPEPVDRGVALSRRDPFQAYMREVQRYPLLTHDEERDLTTRYVETGDPAIARRLVTSNLRLVIKLAYEYRRAYKNMMDLIQEGNIGLMQAVTRYDPYRGVKLSSYSAWWIRAYMLRFILNNWRLVKLGTTQAQRKLFFNLNKQKAKLSAMGIEPTAEEIAERLGVKTSEVQEMDRRLSSGEASLDAPLGDSDGRSIPRIEMLASSDRGADEAVAQQQLSSMLNERLARFRATLSGKDLIIFDQRLVAEDPLTLQKLGEDFGVSRERVRQLEARLAGKLREYLKSELGDAVELGV